MRARAAHPRGPVASTSQPSRGVQRAVAHVNGEIAAAIRGFDALAQRDLDTRLLTLDGTARLERRRNRPHLHTRRAVAVIMTP